MVGEIANYIAAFAGMCALGYLIWLAAHTDTERTDEDDARAFFDEHGRWPDEPEEAGIPRAAGSYADVDLLPHQREQD
ncbi:hypothetical protein DSM112329_01535 [Paraconexibacter sp. AEG42_29]|uniref:Cbb3-type cytochrome c oxidase subunit 3 n=1 Tax=Paraconexibacter sp. AEG42_29 TaxID=2997339 RepID=A0AAU7ASW0_9ACTN